MSLSLFLMESDTLNSGLIDFVAIDNHLAARANDAVKPPNAFILFQNEKEKMLSTIDLAIETIRLAKESLALKVSSPR